MCVCVRVCVHWYVGLNIININHDTLGCVANSNDQQCVFVRNLFVDICLEIYKKK